MDIFSNQYNYGQNFYQNNNGQNLYIERNNLYQYNNNTLNNNFINFSDMNQKRPPNNVQRKSNKNRNLFEPDARLNLFLQNLGLSNYIVNFQRNGITFEDFLALNRKDFNLIKIPNNVQEILELFIIDYVKIGSLYTEEEIEQFFQRKNQKTPPQNNANIMGNMRNNLRARQPMNNLGMANNQMKMKQKNSKNNLYNQKSINRAKSQSNKQINYKQLLDNNMNLQYGNNYGIINNQNMNNNNNNIGYQYYSNNIKKSNNMIRQNKTNKTANINRKKNLINNSSNINNNYSSSISNMNIYSPSVDNFSHLAIEENNSNLDNLKKMAKFRDMNNCNYNNLKRNLSGDVNFNDINELKSIHNVNNKSSGKNNIIEQMDKVLQRIQTRKENIYASTQASNNYHNFRENSINANINKGYHSDGYLNEQKKIEQYNNLIKNSKNNNNYNYKTIKNNNYSYNNNNIKLNGYEINSYYTGDTSRFDSLRGESNNATPVVKKIRGKTEKILYYSKKNKIREEQKKKIEHILGYGALSVTPKTPLNYTDKVFNTRGNSFNNEKGMSMYNFDIYNNNEDEIDSLNKNNSKTNLTNYTYGYNNNYVRPFNMNINKNPNYQLFSRKNNNNVIIQKNTLVQSKIPQKQYNKNKYNNAKIFNNFNNNYANNKGNLSTNLNNNNNQGIKINSNIIGIKNNNNKNKSKNQNNRPHSHYGPIQIQTKNGRKLNDNNNNYNNMNQNYNKRTNNFMNNFSNTKFNNQSPINFSVGRTGNNYNDIMTNNYFNPIVNVNNSKAMKRNAKSLEKYREQLNIGIYPGIHNINNNINNININNINYDGKALSNGFNNFMEMNKEMNYQTTNNFYKPNDLNEEIFFDEII